MELIDKANQRAVFMASVAPSEAARDIMKEHDDIF